MESYRVGVFVEGAEREGAFMTAFLHISIHFAPHCKTLQGVRRCVITAPQ